ncbi:MAG: DUF5666 domain-containing protein [Anaerolineae bacterium]|nr:DUF5666 domain-containing protein [Anaerolineae bacterium]
MKPPRLLGLRLAVILGMLLMAFAVPAIAAADEDEAEEIEFTGTVETVDEEAGTIVVSVEEDGETVEYTVYPPDDFDWTSIAEGDLVEVEGTLDDDGNVLASKVKVETEDEEDEDQDDEDQDDEDEEEDEDDQDDEDDEDGYTSGNYFCQNPDATHPAGQRLATLYGVPYEQVMEWFCEGGHGFGQIMLGLHTARVISGTMPISDTLDLELGDLAGTFLEQRAAGQGWGRIWQESSLVGRARKAAASQTESETESEDEGSTETGAVGAQGAQQQGSGKPKTGGGRARRLGQLQGTGKAAGVGRPQNPGGGRKAGR